MVSRKLMNEEQLLQHKRYLNNKNANKFYHKKKIEEYEDNIIELIKLYNSISIDDNDEDDEKKLLLIDIYEEKLQIKKFDKLNTILKMNNIFNIEYSNDDD